MGRTTFSTKHSSDYHVVESKSGAKLVTSPSGVTYLPKGHFGIGEVLLTWEDAWVLYKFLETLDSPSTPTPEARL